MIYRLIRIPIICGLALIAFSCKPSAGGNGENGQPLIDAGNGQPLEDAENGQITCNPGEIECDDMCVNPQTNPHHCGQCNKQCESNHSCIDGVCTPPECSPGETESCYTGPPGTETNPPCQPGTRTCGTNGFWGPCDDETTPIPEICYNGIDDDCSGITDEGCACDEGLPSDSDDPIHYAMAMGICEFTTEDSEEWGLISAYFSLADGTGNPNPKARSIRPSFGATQVQEGNKLVVLSSGHAAAVGDTNPPFAEFQEGKILGTSSGFPADWLDANGGSLPNAPGCFAPDGNKAKDPIMLNLRIRVPDNANSFTISTNFFSAEYPQWVCSGYNDFFVVLLDSSFSGDPPNPADKNLATYTTPDNSVYPIGVNLAYGDTGLFRQCLNGQAGCEQTATPSQITTCEGTEELLGTGFDIQASGCGSNNLTGGGTGWLVTSGNVVPGEIIELRIAIWDTGDHILDSVALIDGFYWNMEAKDPGTIIKLSQEL